MHDGVMPFYMEVLKVVLDWYLELTLPLTSRPFSKPPQKNRPEILRVTQHYSVSLLGGLKSYQNSNLFSWCWETFYSNIAKTVFLDLWWKPFSNGNAQFKYIIRLFWHFWTDLRIALVQKYRMNLYKSPSVKVSCFEIYH